MRIINFFLLFYFLFLFGKVNADSWLCGTPLLCERYSNIQDINVNGMTNVAPAPAAPIKVGQVERFFVHIPETSVNAICINIGVNCYIYIDTSVQNLLTENDAKAITDVFDEKIYSGVQEWMGSQFTPGIDRDNKITILLHDVGMNKSGHDYGGYFSPTDLQPTHPTSNRRDILYMDIYQFKERTRHTFYSSLAHEFAHLVSWYQNGGTNDQRWLEEGLASFTEWGVYGTVHTLFVDNYLSNPSLSLTTANTSDIYYGAAFMYLLYLYENYGSKSIIRRISAEDTLGLEGIGKSLKGAELIDTFLNWGIANWINNPNFGRDFSYRYLRNRKIDAKIPVISSYPSRLNRTVESWGFQYSLYKNLPERMEISLQGQPQVDLYAKIVYLLPNSNKPVVLPIHSNPDRNNGINTTTYTITLEKLKPEGQILVILTSPYTQVFTSIANPTIDLNPIDISDENDVPPSNINNRFRISLPDSIKYPPRSKTETINLQNTQTGIILSNTSFQLKPRTQIHLSSNYQDIIIVDGYAYTTSTWGLEVFSVGNDLTKISEIETPGSAGSIANDGENLFIADGNSGIHLIDISKPELLRILKTIKGFQDVSYIHIANGNMYALDTIRGLLVYRMQDIYNLENPHPKRTFIPTGIPLSVSTKGEDVYLSDNAVGVYILKPDPLGGFNVKGTYPLAVQDFEIGDDLIKLASNNLHIINVDDPVEPKPISRLNTPGLTSSIYRQQDFLYLTDIHAGFHIVNIVNPFKPVLVASHPTVGSANSLVLWQTETSDEYAYIADGLGGIQTFDITNPYSPKWLTQYDAGGKAYDLDITNNGSRIAVAHGDGGLKVIELSDPYTGRMLQEIRSIKEELGTICVSIDKDLAFIGLEDGMEVINIISGDTLAEINTEHPVFAIDLIGDYAYLCAGSLVVVDISRIELSRIISNRKLNGSAYKIDHNSTHAFIAALEGGLHILDISNPSQPRPIHHYQTEGAATNVTISDDHIYILDTHIGVQKLENRNHDNLKVISTYEGTTIPIVAKVKDDLLFLLDVESLQVIHTDTMLRERRYTQFHVPADLLVTDNAIYIADLYQLNIYQIDTKLSNLGVEDYREDDLSFRDLSQRSLNQLLQNYPNPFNPETWIPISLATKTDFSLSIHDEKGHIVAFKEYGTHSEGKHILYWDGRNTSNEKVASGIYFYTIKAGDFKATRKMVIRR